MTETSSNTNRPQPVHQILLSIFREGLGTSALFLGDVMGLPHMVGILTSIYNPFPLPTALDSGLRHTGGLQVMSST